MAKFKAILEIDDPTDLLSSAQVEETIEDCLGISEIDVVSSKITILNDEE